MSYIGTRFAFVGLFLLGSVVSVEGAATREIKAAASPDRLVAYSSGWYVWYQYPGQRWHTIGPYKNENDAWTVADTYSARGAQVDVKPHP
jgi:hypothetical protein